MKRTILAILATLAIALPAKAGEIPSKADILKGLLVVGVYSRICPTPLSESAKAETLIVLRMLSNEDSALLERNITAYSDALASQDVGPWCRDTATALDKAGFGPPATGPQS